jgi:hypoxanthine phosphoribosyltransferase
MTDVSKRANITKKKDSLERMVGFRTDFDESQKVFDVPPEELKVPNDLRDQVRDSLEEIIALHLEDDVSLGDGLRIAEAVGRVDLIRARIAQGFVLEEHKSPLSLCLAAFKYGTEEQHIEAIKVMEDMGIGQYSMIDKSEKVEREIQQINDHFHFYRSQYPLNNRHYFEGGKPFSAYQLNAAAELLKTDYDLVIGLQSGGVLFAALLEMLGMNVRYLSWHREWAPTGRSPEWEQIGSVQEKPTTAQKILLCEDDSVTGNTLDVVGKFLSNLGADRTDIFFKNHWIESNRENTEDSAFFANAIDANTFESSGFYDKLVDLRKRAERSVERLLVDSDA